ncbi:glycosyltransferase [Streptomyces sp. BE20]|uniref:glycosyltransferase family 2 protein n=1 Tax=Streptomyces sp. BE20 TaxID=3002525 RepID=UPI002E764814|nr:glycosyltransferase [Streptomyces sp. BE20]MEE1827477.1 glycosyltransferase [Streptomyces sp. BE20]
MTVPDVTVVIAVYNTMPYLIACLDSLVRQTIGHVRMEVVAVDDGSTDGGGAVLDDYAARHPGLFQVVHQANSGGPAAPTNRGLALARGRYVLFLGADDWLGGEALERMVAAADDWESDVLIPKQIGVNGRLVPQGIFGGTSPSVGFEDSALAWALADTKLFRLDLIRRHNLARKEELKVYSDQPFTLAACLRARRISVLADYDYYFLVLREDRGNVTQRAGALDRIRGVAAVQWVAAELAAPGGQLDAIKARHFGWEVPQLLQGDFLRLDEGLQGEICGGVGDLVRQFGAREVYHRITVSDRLRLELAAAGRVDAVRELIAYEAEHGDPPVVADGRQRYAGYPAFRDGGPGLPDDLFLLGEEPAPDEAPQLRLVQQLWRGAVPVQVRRRLRRYPAWRRFAESVAAPAADRPEGGRG